MVRFQSLMFTCFWLILMYHGKTEYFLVWLEFLPRVHTAWFMLIFIPIWHWTSFPISLLPYLFQLCSHKPDTLECPSPTVSSNRIDDSSPDTADVNILQGTNTSPKLIIDGVYKPETIHRPVLTDLLERLDKTDAIKLSATMDRRSLDFPINLTYGFIMDDVHNLFVYGTVTVSFSLFHSSTLS